MQRSVITVSWIMSVSGGCVERRQLTNEIENIKIDTAVTGRQSLPSYFQYKLFTSLAAAADSGLIHPDQLSSQLFSQRPRDPGRLTSLF